MTNYMGQFLQLVKILPAFNEMKPECSLPYSQDPVTVTYLEVAESNPYLHIVFKMCFNPLNPSGNYIFQLSEQSAKVFVVFMGIV
jgi:hypothetical protein